MNNHKETHKLDVLDDKSGQTVTPGEPSFEQIRDRAYEVHVQRGRIDGFDIEDWLQAEREQSHTKAHYLIAWAQRDGEGSQRSR